MPISLYYGEEQYLLAQALKQLREKTIQPEWGSLSHKVLENPSIGEVMEAAGSVGFNLGGQTLIEVHEFAWLNKKATHPADERQLDELLELLETLGDGKHLLFYSKKVNKTFKFSKRLTSSKTLKIDVQEYKPLNFWQADEAAARIMQESKKRGIQMAPKAANVLVEHYGVELLPLMNEVEKLSVYAAGRVIQAEDLVRLSNHNENVFQMLADWLHQRHRAKIFQTLDELLLRQHPVQLFALTQSYLNNIFQLRYWQSLGFSEAAIAERTKKHPFKVKKDLQEFAPVPMARLELLKEKALELEWKSKTGELNDRAAYEILMGS